MKRRQPKSRLTKTDVNRICEMQKEIDQYDYFLANLLIRLCQPDAQVIGIETNSPYSNIIWEEIDKLLNQIKTSKS